MKLYRCLAKRVDLIEIAKYLHKCVEVNSDIRSMNCDFNELVKYCKKSQLIELLSLDSRIIYNTCKFGSMLDNINCDKHVGWLIYEQYKAACIHKNFSAISYDVFIEWVGDIESTAIQKRRDRLL